jgi:hypothetical protein
VRIGDLQLGSTGFIGQFGDVEVGPRDAKDTGFSGKMILRQQPQSVDDVIETRIAVVGNGEFLQA